MHEGGIRIEHCDDGAWRFIKPNGEPPDGCAPNHTRPFTHWQVVPKQNADHGVHVDARSGATRWCG